MDDELLKLECLKVAMQGLKDANIPHKEPFEVADRIFNWVKDRSNGDLGGSGKARVVGKDNDLPKDYRPD